MPFLVHQALAMSLLGSGASHAGARASGPRDGLPQQPLGLELPQCLEYKRAPTSDHTTAVSARVQALGLTFLESTPFASTLPPVIASQSQVV